MSENPVAPGVPSNIGAFQIIGTTVDTGNFQQRAESAFRDGRYEESLDLVEQAIRQNEQNGLLYLFSSQARFAIGDFQRAAADLETATNVLPSEQWNFVVKNYRSFYGKNDYVRQMDALSDQIAERPTDFAQLTLRGYQYGALGYPAAATKDFERALKINPDGSLARRLLPELGKPDAPIVSPAVEQPLPSGELLIPEELPTPSGLEEIEAPLSQLRPAPPSNNLAPELSGPLR